MREEEDLHFISQRLFVHPFLYNVDSMAYLAPAESCLTWVLFPWLANPCETRCSFFASTCTAVPDGGSCDLLQHQHVYAFIPHVLPIWSIASAKTHAISKHALTAVTCTPLSRTFLLCLYRKGGKPGGVNPGANPGFIPVANPKMMKHTCPS